MEETALVAANGAFRTTSTYRITWEAISMTRKLVAALCACLLLAVAAPIAGAQEAATSQDHTITNPADGTEIAITVHKPGVATADSQVPVVFHSHGWGGSRSRSASSFSAFLQAGFGVVSIDQRGHGDSGGQAHVQDPERETEDIKAVIDFVASLDWVLKDTDESGAPIADDPILGAIGGSYGGGYQTMTALDEIADEGRTRFNALAPEITWYDLPESLAPQGVVRTAWVAALYAVGARMVPQHIHEAFAWGSATGQWPDGTLYGQPAPGAPDIDSVFHEHGPVAFAERGIQIDIPVLLRQGISDNLFNLNQGLHIFDQAVSDEARSQSFLVGYNGGHALPNVLPAGTASGSDACSGNFTNLRVEFFRRVFAGESTDGLLPARYNLTTVNGGNCLRMDAMGYDDPLPVELVGGSVATPTGGGAPLHLPVAEGPLTVSGIPKLTGEATSGVLDARAFFALSIGSSPATAQVVQNNMMPLRNALPSVGEEFEIELPGVAVEVPEGQTLYLTISPVSDMSFGHGSRTPGGFVLSDLQVRLPSERTFHAEGKTCGPPDGQGNGKGAEKCAENKDKECGPPEDKGGGKGGEKCHEGDED